MDTDNRYHVNLKLTLRPIWFNKLPTVSVCVNNMQQTHTLSAPTEIEFDYYTETGNNQLKIEFFGKTNQDTCTKTNQDTAIVIESIEFNSISSPKFIWDGIYQPDYPEQWFQEQRELGNTPAARLTNCTYLGWNGIWTLDFAVPVFTWIHRTLDLGWIHH